MNGVIAQCVSLTCHGNAVIRGHRVESVGSTMMARTRTLIVILAGVFTSCCGPIRYENDADYLRAGFDKRYEGVFIDWRPSEENPETRLKVLLARCGFTNFKYKSFHTRTPGRNDTLILKGIGLYDQETEYIVFRIGQKPVSYVVPPGAVIDVHGRVVATFHPGPSGPVYRFPDGTEY